MLERTSRTRSTTLPRRGATEAEDAEVTSADDVREPEKIVAIDAEYLSGQRFPYQEDIALVEDVDLEAATPGRGHQLARGRRAARGGGHAGGLRPLLELVPEDLLPDPRGPRGRDRAQGADQAPAVGQLLRHPAQGARTRSSRSPSSARGSRARATVGDGLAAAGARGLGAAGSLTMRAGSVRPRHRRGRARPLHRLAPRPARRGGPRRRQDRRRRRRLGHRVRRRAQQLLPAGDVTS